MRAKFKKSKHYTCGSNKEWCKVLENIDKEVKCEVFPEVEPIRHCPHRLPCGLCSITERKCPLKPRHLSIVW